MLVTLTFLKNKNVSKECRTLRKNGRNRQEAGPKDVYASDKRIPLLCDCCSRMQQCGMHHCISGIPSSVEASRSIDVHPATLWRGLDPRVAASTSGQCLLLSRCRQAWAPFPPPQVRAGLCSREHGPTRVGVKMFRALLCSAHCTAGF